MKILLNDNHIPHAYMLATGLPRFQFVHPLWNGRFRPVPQNVQLIPFPACLCERYDAVIDDDHSLPTLPATTHRRIFLQHCEHDGGNPARHESLREAIRRTDCTVVVSAHKRATMRELAFHEKVTVIGFGFSPDEWPARDAPIQGRIGSAGSNLNTNLEMRYLAEKLSAGFKFRMIGFDNEQVNFMEVVEPPSFEDYKTELRSLSVFVYLVGGEAFGMAPMEAMASGVPVVCGNMPEANDICFRSFNCWNSLLPAVHSIEWMRWKIADLLANPEPAAEMGRQARNTILSLCALNRIAYQWKLVLS